MKDKKCKALELLKKLDYHIDTTHLDMGGKHKYSLRHSGFAIVSEIKGFLYEQSKK